jgi:predicted transcriptional regulator
MRFSQTDLKILEQLANGTKHIKHIAVAINKSDKQIYRSCQKLKNIDFISLTKGKIEPRKSTHITLLLQLLATYQNIIQHISGSGLQILIALVKPKTVEQIMMETGLKKSVIYDKIKQDINVSIVIQDKSHKYVINEKIWKNLKDFLEEYKKYEETTDIRVPANSTIYFKNDREIIFSNKGDQDAVLTGFSSYSNYGLKLLLPTNFYYLPKKTLSVQEIFLHSLYIIGKEKDSRYFMYASLFYLKFKHDFSTILHPTLKKIVRILNGKNIGEYPTLEELKEKAELYDITI